VSLADLPAVKRRALDAMASYYLTLFVPWDVDSHAVPVPLTFASFVAWFEGADGVGPRLVERPWMSRNFFPSRCGPTRARSCGPVLPCLAVPPACGRVPTCGRVPM
jgi:hypothetical protein